MDQVVVSPVKVAPNITCVPSSSPEATSPVAGSAGTDIAFGSFGPDLIYSEAMDPLSPSKQNFIVALPATVMPQINYSENGTSIYKKKLKSRLTELLEIQGTSTKDPVQGSLPPIQLDSSFDGCLSALGEYAT